MAKKEEKEVRVIYKKDPKLCVPGIATYEAAVAALAEALHHYPEPDYRVRNCLRSRTQTWDIVVKVRTEVAA